MGLFDPLVLQGAAAGMLQGRQQQLALAQQQSDLGIRQQTADTLAMQAKNEALAPFRAEIARQLQVHDQYRPYHQASLITQAQVPYSKYTTTNEAGQTVENDLWDPNPGQRQKNIDAAMGEWEKGVDAYRQALATDDPDQVAAIMQASFAKHGGLPPAAPRVGNSTTAPANGAVSPGDTPGLPSLTRPDGPTLTNPLDAPLIPDLGFRGGLRMDIGQAMQEPIEKVMAGRWVYPPRGGSATYVPEPSPAPPAPEPIGGHYMTPPRGGKAVWVPDYGPAPHVTHSFIGPSLPPPAVPPSPAPVVKPAAVAPAPSDETAKAPVPTGPTVLPPGLTPPASLRPFTPQLNDPRLNTDLAATERAYQQQLLQHPAGLLAAPTAPPPLPRPVTTPNANPQVPSSQTTPQPLSSYNSQQPNPDAGMVAGRGLPGSQNPSQAQGAPFLAQGPDGQPVFRVPGVGDVPAVSAQRVMDQAGRDPAYQAAHKYADYIRLVASLGPIDSTNVEKAVTAEATTWSNALQRYGELDKMPTDQLNTLMTAWTGEVTAKVAAQKAPSEIDLNAANAAEARERTRLLAPQFELSVNDSIARNLVSLHQAELYDRQGQEAVARAAHEDADRQNIPNENRIKFIDADMRGRAELLKANAYWKAWTKDPSQTDQTYIAQNDSVMGNAINGLGGNGAPINTLNAWIVIKRAESDPNDAVYQRAKEGALQTLKAATAAYYGGHPELVNGPVPEYIAWRGRDLWGKYGANGLGQFLNKNDDTSRQAVDAMRSWRAFDQMMNGGGPGDYSKKLADPSSFARWVNGVQRGWSNWWQQHPLPWSGIGQQNQANRSFIPPSAPGTVAPNHPNAVPTPPPGTPARPTYGQPGYAPPP